MLIFLMLLLVTYRQVVGQLACPALGVSTGFGNNLPLSSESFSMLLDQSEPGVGDNRNASINAGYCKLHI